MITIKRHTEGDSRVAKEIPTIDEFRQANLDHQNDVISLALFFSNRLSQTVANHDWTKTTEPYQSMFYRDLCAVMEHRMEFFDGEWSKLHYEKLERHHLKRFCPEDVNLFDVIEMLCDCVSAGLARSGDVYDVDIPADILTKAVSNTVKILKDECSIEE